MEQWMEASENSRERVLVCLSPSPTNRRIIEEASELVKAFHADFTALYVQKSEEDHLSAEDETRLNNNIRFAKAQGADITTVIGENVSLQIAEFARISGVTKIVIGRSNVKRYHFWERQTITDQLIAVAPNIDIYIIPDSKTDGKGSRSRTFARQILPTWKDLLITAAMLIGVTALCYGFSLLGFTEANIITVYILGVLINAILTTSHLCSFISSFCSVLLFNYFFIEPKLTLQAYEPEYTVTFIIMLIAALLTGSLAYRLKGIARESAGAAYRTKVLFDTNQLLQKSRTVEEVLEVTANQVILLMDREVVIYPVENGCLCPGSVYKKEEAGTPAKPLQGIDAEAVQQVLEKQKKAGATTGTFPEASCLYFAIRINGVVYGVLGIPAEKAPKSFEYSILMSILGESALAIENLNNEKAKEEAAVMAQKEQLRANLLRAISHDLRTPLTSISGNANNLLMHYKLLEDGEREQIFRDINDEAEWLIHLVENLLYVTRIENNEMKLNRSMEVLDDVIDEAMNHLDRQKEEHRITVIRPEELVIAEIDAKLIIQVVVNIMNNAIHYTQKGSEIRLVYGTDGDQVYVKISDNGPGMNQEMKEHVFDAFYTGQNKTADSRRSMGLGLALCKSVIDAHGGKLTVEDNEPCGCVFAFYLKKGDVTLNE